MTTRDRKDVDELVSTLKNLELPPRQRELLNAMMKVLSDIREGDDQSPFAPEFSDAFTEEQAERVIRYVTPEPSTDAIIRSTSAVIRNPGAVPPAIVKSPGGIIKSPPPNPGDDDR